ncbi:Protein UBASH3A -like protein [Trichinella nativa]|uniref:Protein UBASH3A-like protein n=2 Tax=Trichinella nativa TaxID=6335 RepID=A0A0V1LAZ5_9BILA|nr:Protein UBASH3A -like protein [Trichinella nativa]OUC41046.1 putative phosphoglycerate mutase family protein [Trichinella nativa]OUC41088.1 putative phosphoglycerate mutase family protein [Trichinella nativa]
MANEPQPINALPEGQSEAKGDKVQENKETVELSGRRIFLVRHGERMDRVFPGWLRLGFTDLGAYRPYDLNMPLRAVKRENGWKDFYNDPPITEIGYATSQMIGRGMKLSGIGFDMVYCSPALRSIQSAHGILKSFAGSNTKICIEAGLFEYLGWYENANLNFLNTDQLVSEGYEIQPNYIPYMMAQTLKDKFHSETIEEYYKRVNTVVNYIVSLHGKTKCNLLFVVHAPTIDAIGRSMMKKSAANLSNYELSKMGIHYPYASVVGLEETKANGEWQLMPNILPPISCLDFSNRVNLNYFTRP